MEAGPVSVLPAEAVEGGTVAVAAEGADPGPPAVCSHLHPQQ